MTWLPIRWIVAPGYQVAAVRAQPAVMPAMISSRPRDRDYLGPPLRAAAVDDLLAVGGVKGEERLGIAGVDRPLLPSELGQHLLGGGHRSSAVGLVVGSAIVSFSASLYGRTRVRSPGVTRVAQPVRPG